MSKTEHRSTSRVLSILQLLASSPEGLSLAELAQATDSPKSSLFPIIHTMLDQNFLSYEASTQRYFIGFSAYVVGGAYLSRNFIYENILSKMKDIVSQCSEICQLGILKGSKVLYLAKVDSPEPVRLISHVGKQLPAYCTSLGKSLLSSFSKEELRTMYPEPFASLTPNSVKNIDDLFAQIEEIRRTSIAVEEGETHPDISCIATPLIKHNEVVAAVSVSVPSFRFTPEKRQQIEKILLDAKSDFEEILLQNDLLK